MPTLRAHRSPLRARQAEARARLAVLRAEVADILQAFPELRGELTRPPQRSTMELVPSSEVRLHHRHSTGGRYAAH